MEAFLATDHINNTLAEVLIKLHNCPEIEGILTLGSTATQTLNPSSDLDICIIWNGIIVPPWLVLTRVEGRLAEFYFVPVADFEALTSPTNASVHTDSRQALFLRWLLRGTLVFDRNDTLARLKTTLEAGYHIELWSESELYRQWFRLNYNLKETSRLIFSPDPAVLFSIDLRLLYGLSDLILNYFRFRGIPWSGEKEAVRFLMKNDAPFLDMFQTCLVEQNRHKKLEYYAELTARCVAPYSTVLPANFTMVELENNQNWAIPDVLAGLEFWQKLLT